MSRFAPGVAYRAQVALTTDSPFIGLLYLREATHSNVMWQADHTPLDIWLLDKADKPARPYLY